MDPLILSLIISGLGQGLYKAIEKVIEKGVVDPALEKGIDPIRAIIYRGYDERKDEKELRQILNDTLDEITKSDNVDQYDKLIATLKLTGLTTSTQACVAAAAIEMASYDPTLIPYQLINELGLDNSKRELLAQFLFVFRKKLAESEKFSRAISYADRLNKQGLLQGISLQMLLLFQKSQRIVDIEEAIIADRRLGTDDAIALRDYLSVVRQQLCYLPLPLARAATGNVKADAELKQIFVPLEIKEKNSFRTNEIDIREVINAHDKFILLGPPGSGKTTLLRRIALAFAEGKAMEDLGWRNGLLLPIFVRLRNFGSFLIQNSAKFSGPGPGALTAYLDHYFREEYRLLLTPSFFDRRLREGNCFILLDGLDEVSQGRSEVAQQVNAFIRFYGRSEKGEFPKSKPSDQRGLDLSIDLTNMEEPEYDGLVLKKDSSEKPSRIGNRFGLASRPKGYQTVETSLRTSSLVECEVEPLNELGISQLIRNLLSIIENNSLQRNKDLQGLQAVILNSPHLMEIASTPLFCTALVLVYKYHGAKLPHRRVDVFQEIVDLLLGFWKAQEQELARANDLALDDGTGALFPDLISAVNVKKRRLSYLAYKMQEERKAEISKEDAVNTLIEFMCQKERVKIDQAEEWANNFLRNSHERSGLLIELEEGIYSFSHQNFREYSAATALLNQRENQFINIVLEHINDDWWEQVLLLACAHPNLPEGLRIHIIEKILEIDNALETKADKNFVHRVEFAGLAARDMGHFLPYPELMIVEQSLVDCMTDISVNIENRVTCGDILDSLGWLPPDLYRFIPIADNNKNILFWISKYPVTNIQYNRFLQSKDYQSNQYWSKFPIFDKYGEFHGETSGNFFNEAYDQNKILDSQKGFPVTNISWYEANAYAQWITFHWNEILEHRSNPELCPSTVRLPLETEWVFAAGGKGNGRFPWEETGQKIRSVKEVRQRANMCILNKKTCVSMYLFSRSFPFGLVDMAGNCWEWVQNYGDISKEFITIKGGSYVSQHWAGKVGYRERRSPNGVYDDIGFRIVVLNS